MSSPLPLPRNIQEMILAKLPVEDLLRSRAACKFWGRITTTGSFQQRYGASIHCSRPWYLFVHSRTSGFISASDITGKPRFVSNQPWIPTAKRHLIASSSHGLLLLVKWVLGEGDTRLARFSVVNPLTKQTKDLPPLQLNSNYHLVYFQILCSRDDSSYKVFALGVLKGGPSLSGVFRHLGLQAPPPHRIGGTEIGMLMPDTTSEFKESVIFIYSSDSGSWSTPAAGFPREIVLPFRCLCKLHQSFVDPIDEVLYCITNDPEEQRSHADRIARFDIRKGEWNPVLIRIPPAVIIQSMMKDRQGRMMLVAMDKKTRQFSRASIRGNRLVIGDRIKIGKNDLPDEPAFFGMMTVWGSGDWLFLHVPMMGASAASGPRVRCRCFNLRSSSFSSSLIGGSEHEMSLKEYLEDDADLLKLVYCPSIRAP